MAAREKDPTAPIRRKARRYPGVEEGASCTQSSFKAGKKAFLYVGMQGGRYKAMFKLDASLAQATRFASKEPERFQVGSTAWVTARFTAAQPLAKAIWEKWLDESHALSFPAAGGGKPTRKRAAKKKVPRRARP